MVWRGKGSGGGYGFREGRLSWWIWFWRGKFSGGVYGFRRGEGSGGGKGFGVVKVVVVDMVLER